MAIVNFIPKIWSSKLLIALRAQLVYGGEGVINRDYEGEIAQAGDTVHIVSFADPAVRDYVKNTNITFDLLTDTDRTLVVDQAKYYAFTVDDIDKRQALNGFVEATTLGASYNLAAATDTYLSGAMAAAVVAGNKLGATAVSSADTAFKMMISLRTKLVKSNVPGQGRWCVVPPEIYAYFLQDARFINAQASADGGTALRTGFVGRIAGFDVFESNTVPAPAGVFTVLAGHGMATTYADQIVETEALRLQAQFGDGVRGLHLYGAKVTRPDALASANVTVT
jgi:hypothetical protein